jgi:hypothetical protein
MLTRCFRGRTPVFAAFDGNHDGLVDSLSHILKTSITEVIAPSLPERINFEMIWRAEGSNMHAEIFPTIGRYLGVGTEIGAVALKYQVSKVYWVGGETFPVLDMHWIAEQYYAQIGKFADLELTQDAFRAVFKADADPWALPREDNYFIIVEDETRNVYETARRYATRATQASVVNVISDDYLMRDYMVDNRELFSADAKAVPAIAPDFARTERNAVLRVALSLTTFGITETDLQHELDLLGWTVAHESTDTSPRGLEWEPRVLTRVRKGLADHLGIDADALRFIIGPPQGLGISEERSAIIKVAPGSELDRAIESLRPAYFYVEDDKDSTNFVGALLYGHVYQSMLPGQFVTYGGKYYEIERINPAGTEGGVVVRRAADHIHDRRSYRQNRTFELADLRLSDSLGASVTVGGTSIRRCLANVRVQTHGYVESSSRSALGTSRTVQMDDIPDRNYANTAVLEVRLPNVDPAVRRTVAVLLNELFVTTFPNSHQFIVAVTSDPEREVTGLLSHVQMEEDSDAIYIAEDSMMDLGLTIAVERNWDRYMEIITDYLAWNASPRPIAVAPKAPGREFVIPDISGLAPAEKGSRLKRFIRKLWPFNRKKKDPVGTTPEPTPSTPQEPSQEPITELPPDPATQVMPEPVSEVVPEVVPEPETTVDGEPTPTDPITPEPEVDAPPVVEGGDDDVTK